MSQLALAIHRAAQDSRLDMRRAAESDRIERQACTAGECPASARDALVDKSRGFNKPPATQPAKLIASNSLSRNQSAVESTTDLDAPHEMAERLKAWPTSERLDTETTTREQTLNHENSRDGVEFRLLVRRREAGALIGKRGANIKRLRDCYASSTFSVPDTGNGPERIVCIKTDPNSQDSILVELTKLLLEKSPENDEQVELKLLIHSSHAGLLIGVGGQSIKKLRNDSRAAIKIYEMCCPLSSERVCAIKAKPPVVVEALKMISAIIGRNPPKGTVKPYDALHFNLSLVDKYGGYLPDELVALAAAMPQQFETDQDQLARSCCELHQPTSDPHCNSRPQQTLLEPMPPLAFPCLSSQIQFGQQRKPKHFATIWRASDLVGPSGRPPPTSGALQEPSAACVTPSRLHQQAFLQQPANLASARLQRFHPYLDQIRCLAPIYRQPPRFFRQQLYQFNALDEEFSHPTTGAEALAAYTAVQQFSRGNAATSNVISQFRPQAAPLVYSHKQLPLISSPSNQCEPGLVWSVATPQRTGQFSDTRGHGPGAPPTGAYNWQREPPSGSLGSKSGSHTVLTDSKIN